MRHKLSLNAWDLWYSYISATPHTIEVDEFFIVVNGLGCFLDGKERNHAYSRSQKRWAKHCPGFKWGCECIHTVVYTYMRKEK